MTGAVALVAVGVAAAWIARSQQAANGATGALPTSGPLIARGCTEVPAGTVLIANDPNGGSVLKELRIKEGQIVKRDEIIAVMGNYPTAEVNLKIAENNLPEGRADARNHLEGHARHRSSARRRCSKSAIENERLATILRNRSGRPPEEK